MKYLEQQKVIELLNVIAHQMDGRTIELDGESYFIEEICENAIEFIEGGSGGLYL